MILGLFGKCFDGDIIEKASAKILCKIPYFGSD